MNLTFIAIQRQLERLTKSKPFNKININLQKVFKRNKIKFIIKY